MMYKEKEEGVTVEEAQEILKKNGLEIPLSQCTAVLAILQMLAEIVVKEHIK